MHLKELILKKTMVHVRILFSFTGTRYNLKVYIIAILPVKGTEAT